MLSWGLWSVSCSLMLWILALLGQIKALINLLGAQTRIFQDYVNTIAADNLVTPHHQDIISHGINSLAPGRFKYHFRYVTFKLIALLDGWGISCEIFLWWTSRDIADEKSTLVQVMAWCRQATSHYLSQCWPRSQSPYGVTRPQWVNYVGLPGPCLPWENISTSYTTSVLNNVRICQCIFV